jgi:hypothetical protein
MQLQSAGCSCVNNKVIRPHMMLLRAPRNSIILYIGNKNKKDILCKMDQKNPKILLFIIMFFMSDSLLLLYNLYYNI